MLTKHTLLAALAVLPSTLAYGGAWHFDTLAKLISTRLDPIISPNATSSHMHRIFGGSNIAAYYDADHYKASPCASNYAQQDGSNYWVPQLFWAEKTLTTDDTVPTGQTYTPIEGSARVYYFLYRDAPDQPVNPFPPGLRMVVGNMSAKSVAERNIPLNAVSFVCQKDMQLGVHNQNLGATNFNFNRDCPDNMKSEIMFPSCWNGQSLYEADGSHMAYPTGVDVGPCPLSHPYRVPAMVLENEWLTNDLHPGVALNGHMIWAHGDTTGYGIHADFAEGWNTTLLEEALNAEDCVGNNLEIAADQCPVFNIQQPADDTLARSCKPTLGLIDEPGSVDSIPIDALPGCNMPWSKGSKPACATPATELDLTGGWLGTPQSSAIVNAAVLSTFRSLNANTLVAATNGTWQNIGCAEPDSLMIDPLMTSYADKQSMTVEICQDFCAELGSPYAGLEFGYTCHCSSQIDPAASQNAAALCAIPCAGDSSETCGGISKYTVYYSSSVAAAGPQAPSSDPTYLGCRASHTIADPLIASGQTPETCRTLCSGSTYFAVQNTGSCKCGDELLMPAGINGRVPESNCQVPCKSDSSVICGGDIYQGVYLVSGTADWSNVTVNSTQIPLQSANSAANTTTNGTLATQTAASGTYTALNAAAYATASTETSISTTAPETTTGASGTCDAVTVTKVFTIYGDATATATADRRSRERRDRRDRLSKQS